MTYPDHAIAIDFRLLLSRRRPRRRIPMALERVLITGGSGFLGFLSRKSKLDRD